jgi:hypothetical protein
MLTAKQLRHGASLERSRNSASETAENLLECGRDVTPRGASAFRKLNSENKIEMRSRKPRFRRVARCRVASVASRGVVSLPSRRAARLCVGAVADGGDTGHAARAHHAPSQARCERFPAETGSLS